MKSPRDILDRISSLIARASSPEKEESRTSAVLAVAMMRQYGVRLTLGDEVIVASGSPPPKSVANGSKPKPPPAPVRRTIIVYRCSGCGDVVQKPGLCVSCLQAREAPGFWRVTCEACGHQAPGANKLERAHDIATFLGFEVVVGADKHDTRTLCPECLSKEHPWQREAR
jgi:hypothetical protein